MNDNRNGLEALPDLTAETIPAPPEGAGLGQTGTDLWTGINTVFSLDEEPHKQAVLLQACRTADQIEELEQARREPGFTLTVLGSQKQEVINPILGELRQLRAAQASLLRVLGLPDSDDATLEKAARRSAAGKRAAQARWGL